MVLVGFETQRQLGIEALHSTVSEAQKPLLGFELLCEMAMARELGFVSLKELSKLLAGQRLEFQVSVALELGKKEGAVPGISRAA